MQMRLMAVVGLAALAAGLSAARADTIATIDGRSNASAGQAGYYEFDSAVDLNTLFSSVNISFDDSSGGLRGSSGNFNVALDYPSATMAHLEFSQNSPSGTGEVIFDLTLSLATADDLAGATSGTFVNTMNPSGPITSAGNFDVTVGPGASIIQPVPLPASAPMFGAALLALAGLGWSARKRQAQ